MTFEFPQDLMRRLEIAAVFLFGSQAHGLATERSDFDFAVLVKDKKILEDYRRKNKIYETLYNLLSGKIKKLCNIDIVFLQTADLQLKYHVVKNGHLLYLGDKKIVGDFLENTTESYADFAPLRRMFHQAILQKI